MFPTFRHAVMFSGMVAVATLGAQTRDYGREKALLEKTLTQLITVLRSINGNGVPESVLNAQWLLTEAEKWQPKMEDEGKNLRESLQLMLDVVLRTRGNTGGL